MVASKDAKDTGGPDGEGLEKWKDGASVACRNVNCLASIGCTYWHFMLKDMLNIHNVLSLLLRLRAT